jgi:hypothetical protein
MHGSEGTTSSEGRQGNDAPANSARRARRSPVRGVSQIVIPRFRTSEATRALSRAWWRGIVNGDGIRGSLEICRHMADSDYTHGKETPGS